MMTIVELNERLDKIDLQEKNTETEKVTIIGGGSGGASAPPTFEKFSLQIVFSQQKLTKKSIEPPQKPIKWLEPPQPKNHSAAPGYDDGLVPECDFSGNETEDSRQPESFEWYFARNPRRTPDVVEPYDDSTRERFVWFLCWYSFSRKFRFSIRSFRLTKQEDATESSPSDERIEVDLWHTPVVSYQFQNHILTEWFPIPSTPRVIRWVIFCCISSWVGTGLLWNRSPSLLNSLREQKWKCSGGFEWLLFSFLIDINESNSPFLL